MNLKENWNRSKEVLGAYFRQGMKEVGAALYGPGTAAQPAEYGMPSTKLPSEIREGMKGDEPAPSQLGSHLKQAQERATPSQEPQRDSREHERE